MSQLSPNVVRCNFCGEESSEPERWFKVGSAPLRYGTQKSTYQLEERQDIHACKPCGMMIHNFLMGLGIRHEYEPILGEQEPFRWGRILVY
jgi:hypothetical protein